MPMGGLPAGSQKSKQKKTESKFYLEHTLIYSPVYCNLTIKCWKTSQPLVSDVTVTFSDLWFVMADVRYNIGQGLEQ